MKQSFVKHLAAAAVLALCFSSMPADAKGRSFKMCYFYLALLEYGPWWIQGTAQQGIAIACYDPAP
jgi:hypothetical protein